MSDFVEGTHVRMRVLKRYSHYNKGDLIAIEFYAARDLAAKRLAEPIDLLVPPPPKTPSRGIADQIVKK